jgi:hypothetical protein
MSLARRLALLAFLAGPFAASAQTSLSAVGAPVHQNFDTLASSGSSIPWTDNATLPGWYSNLSTYSTGNGSSNTGALYSYGATGSGERALGSLPSGSTGTIIFAWRLVNGTGQPLDALRIAYVAEQWRSANTNTQTLSFEYQVAAPGVITDADTPSTGWISFPALDFQSVVNTAAGTLNGNLDANRRMLVAVLPASVPAGHEIWMRWRDPDDLGSDHGFAIDHITVTPLVAPASALDSLCEIQSSGFLPSPRLGHTVQVEGIVTAIIGNGFFAQVSDAERAADPACTPARSSGIFAFRGTGYSNAPTVAVGDRVRLRGVVTEFLPSTAQDQFVLRQLTATGASGGQQVLAGAQPLPTPVSLSPATDLVPGVAPDHLYRYLGMRVQLPTVRVGGPGLGSIDAVNATATASGVFFAYPTVHPRPFRELGLDAVDALVNVVPFPPSVNPPLFDGNAEVLRIDSAAQVGAQLLDPEVGTTIGGLRGVLHYGFKRFTLAPDPGLSLVVDTSGVATPQAVPPRAYEQFTIASFNVYNLEDAPPLTATALDRRLNTLSRAICERLGTPDILGLIEIANLTVLEKLRDAINNNQFGHCPNNPQYSAHFTPPTFAGMGTGYLIARYDVDPGPGVQPRVSGTPVAIGDTVPFASPATPTTVAALFDRPPFLLDATMHQDNGASFPVTVLLNHLRSLSGINDPTPPSPSSQTGQEGWPTNGHRVREKRVQAAAWLSGWIQNRQTSAPTVPIVVMGDLNAFEFSDGYVDVVGIISGNPAPASQVLLPASQIASAPPVVPVVPPLSNLVDALPAAQRYSFNFAGNAQTLDHILVSAATFSAVDTLGVAFARINSDFAVSNFATPAAGRRAADHDPIVGYFGSPGFRSADLAVSVSAAASPVPPSAGTQYTVSVNNPGPNPAQNAQLLLTLSGLCSGCTASVTPPTGWSCSAFSPSAGNLVSTCTRASLPLGSGSFAVSAQPAFSQHGDTITLTAQIGSATADRTAGDNQASAGVQLLGEAVFADGFE